MVSGGWEPKSNGRDGQLVSTSSTQGAQLPPLDYLQELRVMKHLVTTCRFVEPDWCDETWEDRPIIPNGRPNAALDPFNQNYPRTFLVFFPITIVLYLSGSSFTSGFAKALNSDPPVALVSDKARHRQLARCQATSHAPNSIQG